MKKNLILFWSFFKIGAFTFGGGLAMLPLISRIVVDKYHWMTDEELVDMLAIAESTPGVIAVNLATYTGYKLNKIIGSFFATFGVVLPSFIIICLISFFYEQFINIKVISWAFMGIKACVAILILNAGMKLFKHVNKNIFSFVVLGLSFLIALFVPSISTVYIILSGLIIGILYYSICEKIKSKKITNNEQSNEQSSEMLEEGGQE